MSTTTTTASAIAAELCRVAEVFERSGELVLTKPTLSFYQWDEKELFLAAVKAIPKPAKKEYGPETDSYARVRVIHETDALEVSASVLRSSVCQIVEPARPAVFECLPLLSKEEDEALAGAETVGQETVEQ